MFAGYPGTTTNAEGADARAAFGNGVSGKRGAPREFDLLTDTLGSARSTKPAAKAAGDH